MSTALAVPRSAASNSTSPSPDLERELQLGLDDRSPPPVPARSTAASLWCRYQHQRQASQHRQATPHLRLQLQQQQRAASCPLRPAVVEDDPAAAAAAAAAAAVAAAVAAAAIEKSRRNYSPVNHIPPCQPLTACQLVQSGQQAKRRRRHLFSGGGASRRRSASQGPTQNTPPPLPHRASPTAEKSDKELAKVAATVSEATPTSTKQPSLRAKISRFFRLHSRSASQHSPAINQQQQQQQQLSDHQISRPPPPPPSDPLPPPPLPPHQHHQRYQETPEVPPMSPQRRAGFSPVHLLQRPPSGSTIATSLSVAGSLATSPSAFQPQIRRPVPLSAAARVSSATGASTGVAMVIRPAVAPPPQLFSLALQQQQQQLEQQPPPLPLRPAPRLPPRISRQQFAPPADANAAAAAVTTGAANLTLPPRQSSKQLTIGFLENLTQLKRKPWYFGPLSSTDAEDMLNNRPDGTFLVRDSAHDSYIVSLSFRARGQTYHTRIEHNKGKFSFWSQPENHSASTIVEFIESAVAYSKTGNFHYFLSSSMPGTPPIQVSMLYPLSRFTIMTSLQHRCRFEILARTRRDHIDRLPLPAVFKAYLQEKQYFIEYKEDFLIASQTNSEQPAEVFEQ